MKQYTTNEQTAKLIELGFAPKMRIKGVCAKYGTVNIEHETYFDVVELFTILPKTINVFYDLSILSSHKGWWVLYGMIGDGDMWSIEHEVYRNELIDALFAMVVKLKEEGVI